MADDVERTAVDDLLDRFVEGLTPNHHKSMASPSVAIEVRTSDLRESGAALLKQYDAYLSAGAAPVASDGGPSVPETPKASKTPSKTAAKENPHA